MSVGSDVSYINRPSRALSIYAGMFLVALYMPILFIPLFSFNDSLYVKFPLERFTTAWFAELWARESVWAALGASLRVGVAVSVVATALGVMAARAITRRRLPGQGTIVAFVMLPLVIPTIIFGVALLRAPT